MPLYRREHNSRGTTNLRSTNVSTILVSNKSVVKTSTTVWKPEYCLVLIKDKILNFKYN